MANYIFYKFEDNRETSSRVMSSDEFDHIAIAVRAVQNVSRVEELYHMLASAFLEFNDLTFREADRSRFSEPSEREVSLYRIECNMRAATFLTALDMYQEYVCPSDKKRVSRFGIDKKEFGYDAFKFCKALRNYIQHQECFPITVTWPAEVLACHECMRSVHLTIPVKELLEHVDNLNDRTVSDLRALVAKHETVDVSEMFVAALDFISEIHSMVRNTACYRSGNEQEAEFLTQIARDYLEAECFYYRLEGDCEGDCKGMIPYLCQKQLDMIAYFRNRYHCDRRAQLDYVVGFPSNVMHRLSLADKDLAEHVRNNGAVCTVPGTDRVVVSSKYQGQELRKEYCRREISKDGPIVRKC